MNRLVVFFLIGMEIGNRAPLLDGSRAGDFPGAHQHRFAKQGFSGRGVANNGKIADFRSTKFFHKSFGWVVVVESGIALMCSH